ncbi:MAG: triose-phosphate isomerase [Hyphomicrobiaceae bacterium]|nr:MAG: triose-phosphate isomerase [Hyphomicrobiaceae bacterium]
MTAIRQLIAGNWKMNGMQAALAEAKAIVAGLKGSRAEALICPPATLLLPMAEVTRGTALALGGQDCHAAASGAHTGDISAEMLKDAGAAYVIVGHSERRSDHGEGDREVRAKAAAALSAGLLAIVCIGETAGERRAGLAIEVTGRQLERSLPEGATAKNCVVAYEPVWAIGSGLNATATDVAEIHAAIRAALVKRNGETDGGAMRILYGGSVKPSNAKELLATRNVNGALVGGASLKAADFLAIVNAAA